MVYLLVVISTLLKIFNIMILARVLLSWFSVTSNGNFILTLSKFTDPYLFWFQRFRFLRTNVMDFSPIAAFAVLSVAINIVDSLKRSGHVSIGFILALLLGALSSAVSFVFGFFIVVILLRVAAYVFRANIYTPFWSVINHLSSGAIFRISNFFLKNKFAPLSTQLAISLGTLIGGSIVVNVIVNIVSNIFLRLPI